MVPKSPVSSSSSTEPWDPVPVSSQLLPSLSPSFSDTGSLPNTLPTSPVSQLNPASVVFPSCSDSARAQFPVGPGSPLPRLSKPSIDALPVPRGTTPAPGFPALLLDGRDSCHALCVPLKAPWRCALPPPAGSLASLVWGQEVGQGLRGKVLGTGCVSPRSQRVRPGPLAVTHPHAAAAPITLTWLSPPPLTGTFVSAFTVLCGARTDLPDRHVCCVFWLNIAAALIQILTAIVMVGWIMSIFWGMDMVILASE